MRVTKQTKLRERELKTALRDAARVKGTSESVREVIANEDKVNIHVNVLTLYNPMSIPSQRQVNDEIFAFIEESARLFPALVPIRVVLHGVPGEERGKAPRIMKNHHVAVLKDQLWDAVNNMHKTVLLLGGGILLISLYLAMALTNDGSLLIEVLKVIDSFSLWGAADSFLIERRVIKRRMMKTAQFLTMEIAFGDE